MTDKEQRLRLIAECRASPLGRLISSSERGDVAAAKAAIDEGASVTEHDPFYGRTALHAAADDESATVEEYLVASGAPLDVLDKNMMTPPTVFWPESRR